MSTTMQYRIKFFFSFIFLCVTFLRSSAGETKADSLFAASNYFEASIEFERMIFNAQSQYEINECKYKKALCYKQMNEYERAIAELQPIYFSNTNDSLYQWVCYEQAVCFFLNDEPTKAIWKTDEYFHRSTDSTSFIRFMPIRILSFNATCQWDKAKESFNQYIEMQNFLPQMKNKMYLQVENLYRKPPAIRSVKRAENFSRFIPGSGQIYAGKTGEGIFNFLINASILTFSAYQFYHGFYITGYLAGLGFFNKTYQGGIKRSGILAEQKNEQLLNHFNHQINTIILSDPSINSLP